MLGFFKSRSGPSGATSDTTALDRASEGPIDKYLYLADTDLRLVSVFDDLRYDRADVDMLSAAMRRHVIRSFSAQGYKQVSGMVLYDARSDRRLLMPKFHALGASPFDIARYTTRGERDYFVLTPTQTACQFIDNYDTEDALTRIKALIEYQPLNIYRLMDYLEDKSRHNSFKPAIGHLRYVQRKACESERLKAMRSLG